MRVPLFIVAACLAAPAAAQSGVFDPGMLTGALSVDHVTQSEEARAQGREFKSEPRRSASNAQARANCARRGEFARKFGNSDPRVRQLDALCRRAGY